MKDAKAIPTVLLIGPVPPPLGGITVLFAVLADGMMKRPDVRTIPVKFPGGPECPVRNVGRLLSVIGRVLWSISKADVVAVHASTSGLAILAPVVCAMCRLWNKPLIVRKFGGGDYRDFGPIRRALFRWAARRADLYLAEALALVQAARQDKIPSTAWYPNNRPMEPASPPPSVPAGRFVYVSHLRRAKGIFELIEAAERCGGGVSVDVYGPFYDGLDERIFAGKTRVFYKGVLPADRVAPTLRQYSALLLPTYHAGEGYPGVILGGAYRAGVPVIATRWRFLPEIVDETCGILIEPRDPAALTEAMMFLANDPALRDRLAQGAWRRRERFSSEVWVDRFAQYCKAVAAGQPIPDAGADAGRAP